MKNADLLKYARVGAQERLIELRREMDAIYSAFPDLTGRGRPRGGARAASDAEPRKPGRRKWSATQRKAAAERMRKYWAAKSGRK